MVATVNQQASKDDPLINLDANETAVSKVKNVNSAAALLLPSRIVTHSTKAGLNPLVDAAGYLFSAR